LRRTVLFGLQQLVREKLFVGRPAEVRIDQRPVFSILPAAVFRNRSGSSYSTGSSGNFILPSRTARAIASSDLNTPAGGVFDCVVVW
jgi:hypothetical protein